MVFLRRYEQYKLEVVRVARGGIPGVPTKVQGLKSTSDIQILRDVHHGGLTMDDDEGLRMLRVVACLHDGVETSVEVGVCQ